MKRVLISASAVVAALLMAATAQVTAAQGGTGTIVGHVLLTGAAPANPVIRMGMDPLCAKANRGKRPVQEIVLKGANGGLANAFVEVDGTFPSTKVPSDPAVINQRNCVYVPRVLGARVGQTLRIINSDTLVHNVHSLSKKGNTFNETQPHSGMVYNFTLKSAEDMLRIKCDVHSWMTAYVGVMTNPYFAVSSEMGTFTIANVPAGKQTVRAWHERYGRLTKTVDVKAGGMTTVDFTYTGKERPAKADIHDLLVPPGVSEVILQAAS